MDKLTEKLNEGKIEAGTELLIKLEDGTKVNAKIIKVEKDGITVISK